MECFFRTEPWASWQFIAKLCSSKSVKTYETFFSKMKLPQRPPLDAWNAVLPNLPRFLVKFRSYREISVQILRLFSKIQKFYVKKFPAIFFSGHLKKKFDDPANIFRQGSRNLSSQSRRTLLRTKDFWVNWNSFVQNFLCICEIEYSLSGRKFFDNIPKKLFRRPQKNRKTLKTIILSRCASGRLMWSFNKPAESLSSSHRKKTQLPKNTYHFSLKVDFSRRDFLNT